MEGQKTTCLIFHLPIPPYNSYNPAMFAGHDQLRTRVEQSPNLIWFFVAFKTSRQWIGQRDKDIIVLVPVSFWCALWNREGTKLLKHFGITKREIVAAPVELHHQNTGGC